MEKQHTQGEWKAQEKAENGKYPGYELDIYTDGIENIATVWCEKETPNDEERANAQLIAAAPDMLEALQETLDCISDFGFDKTSQEWQRWKRAIDKAKLKQPALTPTERDLITQQHLS